jgi:hypothetical protein
VPFAKAYETRFLAAMSESHRKALLKSLSVLEDATGATHRQGR